MTSAVLFGMFAETLVVCVRTANVGRSQDGVGICTQGTLCEHLG